MLKTIFDRLILVREKGREGFTAKIVRYHPDRAYLETRGYDMSDVHLYGLGDYTGYLEYLTPQSERISVVRVVGGKPVKRYWLGAKPVTQRKVSGDLAVRSGNMAMMSGGYYDCWDECEDTYGETCVPDFDGDPDDPGGDICSEHPIGQSCYQVCDWVYDEEDFCDNPANWGLPECGGNPEPGDPGNPEDPEGSELPDTDFCEELTQSQKDNIINTFTAVLNMNCAANSMVRQLAQVEGLVLTFCISTTVSGSGSYHAATKSIKFSTDFASTHEDVFRHETFHAYQDNVGYSGGIGNYSKGNPGYVNIEFEQAVFKDIMNGYATALASSSNNTIKESYLDWIDELTQEGTAYPNISTISNFETKYFEYLAEFNATDPNYGGGTIVSSLKPDALKKIFNGLLKGNCGI